MCVVNQIRKNVYYDSATLMLLTSAMERDLGPQNIAVMMGTEMNKTILREIALLTMEGEEAMANDLILAARAENREQALKAITMAENQLEQQQAAQQSSAIYRTRTLQSALKKNTKANVAVISVPGLYAHDVAQEALEHNLHVMLFSDNVPLQDEIHLKRIATERNLLMMGPDCGTAILNGVPLGFANAVRRGKIGIVAASGTGLQECCVLISRLGGGISNAIGTGGRDIHEQVEGRMMRSALEIMERDPATEVIVVISKPPSARALAKINEQLIQSTKPIVTCFLGEKQTVLDVSNITATGTLEEAALTSLRLSGVRVPIHGLEADVRKQIIDARTTLSPSQKYIRGLYTGGTLCHEAMLLMRDVVPEVYSNIAISRDETLGDVEPHHHTLIDLGADEFTQGRVHPMIDPEIRNSWIRHQGSDESVAVILLDIVLGYGSHENPAGVVAVAIRELKEQVRNRDRDIAVVLSVCGTEGDPQGYSTQVKILQEVGAIVMPSNAAAVRCALEIINPEGSRERN